MIDEISQVMYLGELLTSRARCEPTLKRGNLAPVAVVVVLGLALTGSPGVVLGQDASARRLQQRLDEANRREAQVLVDLVDRAAAGQPVPADFVMSWHHDFLKAQPGTFVPFVLTLERHAIRSPSALMYVRAARRETRKGSSASEPGGKRPPYAFDAVFPVELVAAPGEAIRVSRGFVVPAGEYDVYVALRQRAEDPLAPSGDQPLKSGVFKRTLSVPDFWSGKFTTSTVMLAHRIEVLERPLGPDEALERPYVLGRNDVHVAFDATFRRESELIVVFVVYDPTLTARGEFDVQVDYQVFQRVFGRKLDGYPDSAPREDERFVTRTNPQRFNPGTLDGQADPATGHPVLAGQGILLNSFEAGEYRLGITVTDLLSGQKLMRDVIFRVAGS
jgi:hypothetical protein